MRRLPFLFLIIIILLANNSIAQVKFYASISNQEVYKDDQITYSLVLENCAKPDSVTSVSFKDFKLLSGPLESWGYAGYNGDIENYFTLNFILKPKKSGKFIIPPSCIVVKGKTFKSNAITIHVKRGKRSSNIPTLITGFPGSGRKNDFRTEDHLLKKGENAEDKIRQNMLIKMELSKTSCYIGEPVVVAYKLFTKLRCDKKIIKTPSFNGLSVIDLLIPEMDYEKEKLNGKEYNVYCIRKSQLYPLQPGEINVDSAEIETSTDLINADGHFANKEDALQFLDAFGLSSLDPSDITNTNLHFTCKSSSLFVKRLPEKNKPVSFKGAVGNLKIRSVLKQSSIAVNETGFLAVSIEGNGNLQLVTSPEINWPQHLEPFDAKTFDKLDLQSVPVSGSRTFEFPFSADSIGTYTIPSVQFSYFDPAKESYNLIETQPLRIEVIPAHTKTIYQNVTLKKKSMVDGFIENRGLVVFIIALLMFTGLIIYVKISHQKPTTVHTFVKKISMPFVEQVRINYSNPQNPFESSTHCLYNDECQQFYKLLQTDLKNFLADKMEVFPSEVHPLIIDKFLEKKNVPNEFAIELNKLMEEIEWQLYTPFVRNEKMLQLYSKAQSVTQHLNQYC